MPGLETIIGPYISPFTMPRPKSASPILSHPSYRHTLIIHCNNPAYIQQPELFRDLTRGHQSAQADDFYMQDVLLLKRVSELERNTIFLERLKEIVLNDGKQYPAIDAVYLVDANGSEGPLWSALEGLTPRHLTICCSMTGYVNCSGLSRLNPPWPLESAVIGNGDSFPFPVQLSGIHTLTLFRCQNISYQPGTGNALRHLSLRECSGGSIFISMCKANRALAQNLETLELESPQLDFLDSTDLDPHEFKRALRRCSSLVSLKLILADTWFSFGSKCSGLAAFLPDNLEQLVIYGPPGMASDLWFWQGLIEDPRWLVNLKTVLLRFEYPGRRSFVDGGEIEDMQNRVAATETEEFLRLLKQFRPDIRTQKETEAYP